MRRKTSIGTKLTVALLALVMLTTCFTTACQPMEAQSIEQDTIATDTPLATASTLPFNQGEIPKHWTETVKISNCLTVNIDTDIVMPKAEQYPVIKVEPISWTQQRIDEMVNYFAKGKKLYEWPRIMTKADYEKELVEARKGSYTDYEYVVTEESLAWVKELEEKKANAPVEAPKKYTDTTLTYRFKDLDGNKDTAAGMNFLSVGVENSDYNDAHIYVCNYSKDLGTNRNGSSNKTSFYYSQGNGYHSESFNEYLIAYIEAEMQSPIDEQFKDKRDVELRNEKQIYLSFKKQMDNIKISEAAAQKQAEKVIHDLNIHGMQLVNVEKAVLPTWGNLWGLDSIQPDIGGYIFEYARQNGGIAGFDIGSYGGHPREKAPKYVPPFDMEQIKIFVSEEGVQQFMWENCAQVTEKVSDTVELLPFAQIRQALIDQIENKMSSSVQVDIKNAELRMVYINTDDSEQALMVPAWVFHAMDMEIYYEDDERKTRDRQLESIMINAIDGGTIHKYSPDLDKR